MKFIKNKKVLIAIGTILIVLTIVFVVVSQTEKAETLETSTPQQTEPYSLPESTINLKEIPTEPDKVIVNETETNNFYKTAEGINESGTAIVKRSAEYEIIYTPEFSRFNITILGAPFVGVKNRAEEEFLNTLGISQETACKLNVVVSTPYFANPNDSGQNYALSFCN